MQIRKYFLLLCVLFFPTVSIAADFVLAGSNFSGILGQARNIIYIVIPMVYVVAFICFFWGLAKFILSADNKEEIKKGKDYMIWGILVIFVLLSYQAIIRLIATDLEVGTGQGPALLNTN